MIKAIAIDDEPVALDIINVHAQKVPYLKLNKLFLSATDALAYLSSTTIDLIFLDINMPDISGLEFVNLIRSKPQVIFTTAHVEHALKGFDLAATDYLLKPINFNRFLQACQLANDRKQQPTNANKAYDESLFVKDGHNWVQIIFDDILYIKAEDNYISIVEQNKYTLTRMKLSDIQNKLPSNHFLKIHKSYIISIPKIIKVENHQVIIANTKIPLSRSCREELLRHLSLKYGL
ncbi:MAG: LytTR family DNA-binding domain-containing protein [Bacteroidota bacterium]